jgi:hypothetical protein
MVFKVFNKLLHFEVRLARALPGFDQALSRDIRRFGAGS